MLSFLTGEIISKEKNFIILNVGGIGFKIFLSSPTFQKISENTKIDLFTYLDITPKTVKLYGFLKKEELEIFETINEISGIGSKTALEISSFDFQIIKKAVEEDDIRFLEKIPGLGPKKAKKVIFEISGKILKEKPKEIFEEDEAFSALINLGFPKNLVKSALSKIPQEIKDVGTKVKEALKILGK